MSLKSCVRIFQRLKISSVISSHSPAGSSAFMFQRKCIHSSAENTESNLTEFFDDESNWGKDEIKTGRSWRLGELRHKSNQDLHKLWYILLKEKNMLLTMEEFCKEQYVLFPSPERIDKVEESMKNLEMAVRERNKAYFLLETGEDGERPGAMVHTAIGLPVYHKQTQHVVPKVCNKWWKGTFQHHFDMEECRKFQQLYREKIRKENLKMKRKRNRHAIAVLTRFKKLDMKYFKEVYPSFRLPENGERPDNINGHFNN